MDYNTLYLSICEIASRLPEILKWEETDITVYYNNRVFNTIEQKYTTDNLHYLVIRVDLTEFEYFDYLMKSYIVEVEDKEFYLVKCIHSIFAEELIKIFNYREEPIIHYKVGENIYPLMVNEKNIII